MNIFVDSSAIVALFRIDDPNHIKAVEIALKYQKNSFLTSDYIFAETVTILSQKVDKKTAISTGEHINKTYSLILIDQKMLDLAWEIFKDQRSKNVSFVDCISFALYQKGIFDKAFTFDKDFKKNKIPVL